jgi:hypothetical protein
VGSEGDGPVLPAILVREKFMKMIRPLGAIFGVLAVALCLAPAALAQSTDIYPAGDTVSASSSPVLIGKTNCTFNPGVFALPAKGNTSGPVTSTFTTRPTYTACDEGWKMETSGTWTISSQYGTAAVTINIPTGGFKETFAGVTLAQNSAGPWTLTGVWNNGFSSPVSVSSSIDLYPSKNTYYYEGAPREITFGSAFSTLSDTTHPGSLLLLGP